MVTRAGTPAPCRTTPSRYPSSTVGTCLQSTSSNRELSWRERPGTIIVDIDQRFLYLVEGDGTAIRYAVGVGRQGFSWSGAAYVGRKSVWPSWSPTSNMVKLIPGLPRYASAGIDNPLGARALYLYQGGRDILFRIHGTKSPGISGRPPPPAASAC